MITLLVAIRLACPQSDAALPAPDLQSLDPVRATVKRAVNWIARQAIASTEHDDTVVFPEAAGKGVQGAQIYGGTAGVLLFLENAAAVLDDARARALADAATNGLLAARSKTASGALTWITRAMPEGATSLYLGDAGIGQAFLTRARLRGDEDALATAVEVADSIIARGKKSDDQLSWDRQVDIIFGAAGTVLFLLDLGEETKEPRFVEAARAAAHWLIQQAVAEPGEDAGRRLLSWRTQMAFGMPYVNFSHGTAGVAYALARVAGAAHDQDCARAAHAGAAWVLEQTIAEGDGMVWPTLARTRRTMGGWCHGPPGTARLFLLLHQQTKEQRYLDVALASARWVMAQAPPESTDGAAPPPKFPPAFCCGVGGVVDFFCDLYRATGKQEFADFAHRAGDYLIQTAIPDGNGVKWARGTTERGSGNTEHGVDLMLGAAGDGLALLRLATLDRKEDPIRHLPDRAVRD